MLSLVVFSFLGVVVALHLLDGSQIADHVPEFLQIDSRRESSSSSSIRLVTRDRADHHPTEIFYLIHFSHMSCTCTITMLHTHPHNTLYHTQTCSTSEEKWFISKSWDSTALRDSRFIPIVRKNKPGTNTAARLVPTPSRGAGSKNLNQTTSTVAPTRSTDPLTILLPKFQVCAEALLPGTLDWGTRKTMFSRNIVVVERRLCRVSRV